MGFCLPEIAAGFDGSVRHVVSQQDQAIDHDKSDLAEYRETMDVRKVVALPGASLVTFDVKPLTQGAFDAIALSDTTGMEQATRFFRAGCVPAIVRLFGVLSFRSS